MAIDNEFKNVFHDAMQHLIEIGYIETFSNETGDDIIRFTQEVNEYRKEGFTNLQILKLLSNKKSSENQSS